MQRAVGHRQFSRGFTLIEVLVVLLIVGMAGSLLFEGAAQVMAMQGRFNRQLENLRGQSLRADWLRQVVQGLQPDYHDGRNKFRGSAKEASGLTTNPLSASYAGLAPFTLAVQRDVPRGEMVLRYGTDKNAPELLRWAGDIGRLRYADTKGEVHDSWPPPLGLWPQLPEAVFLEGGQRTAMWLVVATPYGPIWPKPRPVDILGSMGNKP